MECTLEWRLLFYELRVLSLKKMTFKSILPKNFNVKQDETKDRPFKEDKPLKQVRVEMVAGCLYNNP